MAIKKKTKRKGVNEATREEMKQFGLAKARANAAKKNKFRDGGEVCKNKTRRGMGITQTAFKKLGGGNISSLVNKLRRRGLSEDALIREIEAIAARGKAPYDQFVKTGAGKSLKQQGFKRKGVNEATREEMKQFGLAKARANAAKKNKFRDGGEVCKNKTRRGMGIATRGGGAVS